MSYPCPKCGKENEVSGMCNSGDYQILCDNCNIMYSEEGVIDEFLTQLVQFKPKGKGDEDG